MPDESKPAKISRGEAIRRIAKISLGVGMGMNAVGSLTASARGDVYPGSENNAVQVIGDVSPSEDNQKTRGDVSGNPWQENETAVADRNYGDYNDYSNHNDYHNYSNYGEYVSSGYTSGSGNS